MKLKELLDVYATPEFDMIDLQDECYRSFLRGHTIKELIDCHDEYLNLDVLTFVAYPGGDFSDSVQFVVRVDTKSED